MKNLLNEIIFIPVSFESCIINFIYWFIRIILLIMKLNVIDIKQNQLLTSTMLV
jgi:hypothetical protein